MKRLRLGGIVPTLPECIALAEKDMSGERLRVLLDGESERLSARPRGRALRSLSRATATPPSGLLAQGEVDPLFWPAETSRWKPGTSFSLDGDATS